MFWATTCEGGTKVACLLRRGGNRSDCSRGPDLLLEDSPLARRAASVTAEAHSAASARGPHDARRSSQQIHGPVFIRVPTGITGFFIILRVTSRKLTAECNFRFVLTGSHFSAAPA